MSMRTLKDLGKIVTGNTPKMSERENFDSADIPFIKPGDISDDSITVINKGQFFISENARDKARILPSDSILVTCIGIIGKVGILTREAAFNQQINGIVPDINSVIPRYLAYAILSQKSYLQEKANAAVVPIINKSQFSELKVEVPNLQKQNEIVRNLDKVDHLISLQKQQLKGLDELVKSRFVELFGDPITNEYGFGYTTIGQIATDVKYGTSAPATDTGKYAYLRMNNLTDNGQLDLADLKYIDVSPEDFRKYSVKSGDILFNRTNSADLVGKTALYNLAEPMIIAGYLIRVRVSEIVTPSYLVTFMNLPFMKKKLHHMAKGAVNQANINSQELKSIKILIPPIELQNKFDQWLQQLDKSKLAVQKSLDELEILKKSLMQQYFG